MLAERVENLFMQGHPVSLPSPRVVLVTGATSGIGEACARRFYSEGWHVIGWGRRQERLDALTSFDIANAAFWCASLPQHVNVNTLELMPTGQAFSPFAIDRSGGSRP